MQNIFKYLRIWLKVCAVKYLAFMQRICSYAPMFNIHVCWLCILFCDFCRYQPGCSRYYQVK